MPPKKKKRKREEEDDNEGEEKESEKLILKTREDTKDIYHLTIMIQFLKMEGWNMNLCRLVCDYFGSVGLWMVSYTFDKAGDDSRDVQIFTDRKSAEESARLDLIRFINELLDGFEYWTWKELMEQFPNEFIVSGGKKSKVAVSDSITYSMAKTLPDYMQSQIEVAMPDHVLVELTHLPIYSNK
jgi:hypothetical protein